MLPNDELSLLIKSKYPVVFVESIDEEYVVNQLRGIASQLGPTANDIYRLPPEFLRKGRFDEIFYVNLPDQEIRTSLFAIHLRKRGLDPEKFDCKLLAEKAADFSGAEIEQAVISALYRASSKKEPISTNHILEQIRSTKPLALLKQEEITFPSLFELSVFEKSLNDKLSRNSVYLCREALS